MSIKRTAPNATISKSRYRFRYEWQAILTTRRLSLRTSNRSVLYRCLHARDTLEPRLPIGKSITLSMFKVRGHVDSDTRNFEPDARHVDTFTLGCFSPTRVHNFVVTSRV